MRIRTVPFTAANLKRYEPSLEPTDDYYGDDEIDCPNRCGDISIVIRSEHGRGWWALTAECPNCGTVKEDNI